MSIRTKPRTSILVPEAALLLLSIKNRELWEGQELPVTLRKLRVKSNKSGWRRVQNDQRSRFLVLTKRGAAFGDENDSQPIRLSDLTLSMHRDGLPVLDLPRGRDSWC